MSAFSDFLGWLQRLFGGGPPSPIPVPNDIWKISSNFDGKPVEVLASRNHGAAIYSLKWGGVELINYDDNGRELQTAWQMNNHGEGENPTEAGASADGSPANHSSTIVESVSAVGNVLKTKARLAYWFPFNGAVTSPHRLIKTVTLGYNGLMNVIHHEITINIVGDHQTIRIEGLTSYSPKKLTRLFMYDLMTMTYKSVPFPVDMIYDQKNPYIFATSDLAVAIALLGRSGTFNYGVPGGWPKLDCNCQVIDNVKAGDYSWESFTIFGSLDQVVNSIKVMAYE